MQEIIHCCGAALKIFLLGCFVEHFYINKYICILVLVFKCFKLAQIHNNVNTNIIAAIFHSIYVLLILLIIFGALFLWISCAVSSFSVFSHEICQCMRIFLFIMFACYIAILFSQKHREYWKKPIYLEFLQCGSN